MPRANATIVALEKELEKARAAVQAAQSQVDALNMAIGIARNAQRVRKAKATTPKQPAAAA